MSGALNFLYPIHYIWKPSPMNYRLAVFSYESLRALIQTSTSPIEVMQ